MKSTIGENKFPNSADFVDKISSFSKSEEKSNLQVDKSSSLQSVTEKKLPDSASFVEKILSLNKTEKKSFGEK